MKACSRCATVLVALLFLSLGAATPARAATEGHFDRTLSVSGPADLEVETGAGSIQVRAGGSGKVEIHGTIRASNNWRPSDRDAEEKVRYLESHPPIEQDGNHVRIGRIDDHELARNLSISYELVVPAETKLRAESGSGSQTIEGIAGPLEAGSGSGGLRISGIGQEVHARTGSGSIELRAIRAGVRASTGSGSIQALGVAGSLTASTGSGSVKLEQTAPGDVEIDTGSGSIELSGVKGSVRANTGSGSVHAEGEPTGHWRLYTSSGSVIVRFPARLRLTSRRGRAPATSKPRIQSASGEL
jgi:putative adhesin